MRSIDAAMRDGDFRDELDLRSHWAVRISDLQSLLLRHRPDIVHFSGHGSRSSEIVLQTSEGSSTVVPAKALSSLFSLLSSSVRCVVLNACYSERQARGIADSVDCVIGMSDAIADQAAIMFSAAFYRALSYGRSVREAFDLGCNEIDLHGLPDNCIPQLLGRAALETIHFASSSRREDSGLVIDLGSIRSPENSIDLGEVRFSVSNHTGKALKITAITLRVLRRRLSDSTLTKVPGAPLVENFLFADVTADDTVELLHQHYVLNPSETDGFLLRIASLEGHEIDVQLDVDWHVLGITHRQTISSGPFTIDYPSCTSAALLATVKRRQGRA